MKMKTGAKAVTGLNLILLTILLLLPVAGCSAKPAQPAAVNVNVAALKGPTAMGMVKLMDDSEKTGLKNSFSFEIAASIDEITPKLVRGAVDICAIPANLASVLYHNTNGEIKVIAINTLGVLYIVENGDTVKTVADLRGKTVYTSGKGSVPEYVLNYVLTQNGVDPDRDLTIEFKSEHSECAALLMQSENTVAMLPQPFVTTVQLKDDRIRTAIDLNAEWEALQTGGEKSALITGAAVARTEFIEKHPEAVAEFMREYEKSVSWVNGNIDEASKLIEKYDIVPEAVAKKALPFCNIVFIAGDGMVERFSGYLNILLEQNPKAVGGAVPDGDFYYVAP